MAETLGSLCDKLTVVKLKQWHAEDLRVQETLARQAKQLQEEIEEFLRDAAAGQIPRERLTFPSNKVYKKEGNTVAEVTGGFGDVFARLADTNCRLWHVQEHVYEFDKVPPDRKDAVIKQLALLNLERTRCIDQLDTAFRTLIESGQHRNSTE